MILEEIGMYEDMPGFVAVDHARKLYYGEHPLGNSVLGTTESVTALTRDQMHAYFDRRYVTSNILVSLAGNFDWDATVRLIESHCSDWPQGDAPRGHLTRTPGLGGDHVVVSDKSVQEHVLLVSGGPPAESPQRYAADVLSMAVGDDSGSRLFWELIETGKCESADCNFYEYQANGVFFTMLSCDPEMARENLETTKGVLSAVRRDGITEEELNQAKSKLAARIVRSGERTRGRMQSIAASWVYTGEYRDVDEELARFDEVTLADVRRVLDEYPIDSHTMIAFGPMERMTA